MINPFENISDLEIKKLFILLKSHIYTFNKNQEILSTIKDENIICIMLEGHAHIVNIDYNGDETLIDDLVENSVFGSNISNLDSNECQIISLIPSKILVINYNELINQNYVFYKYYNIFINNLFNIIHSKIKEKNMRIRILTEKTIRNKLLAYFESEYKKKRSKKIQISNSFKGLADYLSVNRSAMFRELKYLKEENFIKIDNRQITLLYTPTIKNNI